MTFRVATNAQLLFDGSSGGGEQFVLGLVYGLGRLEGGPEEFLVIGHRHNPEWLKPYLGPNQRIVSKWRAGERSGNTMKGTKRLLLYSQRAFYRRPYAAFERLCSDHRLEGGRRLHEITAANPPEQAEDRQAIPLKILW